MVPATTEAAGEAKLDGANVCLLYQVRARLHLTGRIAAFRSRAARDPEARLEPVEADRRHKLELLTEDPLSDPPRWRSAGAD